MLGNHFPSFNSFYKIFNCNTIKANYCCIQNLGNTTKLYNKKLICSNNQIILPCNRRKKKKCPLEGKCQANDVVYKCIAWATGFLNKVYLGTAQGEFKKWFYNHNVSFKNKSKKNDTALAKYIWDLRLKHSVMPTLKWQILKSVAPYSNITKKCRLCLQEKFKISHTQTQMSYLIKDLNLFQSAAMWISFC